MTIVQFQKVMVLQCNHEYHASCITPWLISHGTCPLCKYNVLDGKFLLLALVLLVLLFTNVLQACLSFEDLVFELSFEISVEITDVFCKPYLSPGHLYENFQ